MKLAINQENIKSVALSEESEQIILAKRDPVAFGPLYRKYYPAIFRFVLRRTADEALTADLCQDVFLKALKNLPKYKDKGLPFSSWLYRIASNEVNSFYRTLKRKRVVSLDENGAKLLFEELDEGDLQDKINMLKRLMGDLPEKSVKLLELRFFDKCSFKEMGEILEITENNAKIRTYRVLDKLRAKMKK